MHVQSCCFANLNLLFFAVLVAVLVAEAPKLGLNKTAAGRINLGWRVCCKKVANLGLNSGYAFKLLSQIRWSQR